MRCFRPCCAISKARGRRSRSRSICIRTASSHANSPRRWRSAAAPASRDISCWTARAHAACPMRSPAQCATPAARSNSFGGGEVPQVGFIWRLLRYNYRNHRRSLVIDGRVGFTGGYGISDAWTGDGHTPEHWRDTNVRAEGLLVNDLQAAFASSGFGGTGALLGGTGYFPSLEPRGKITAQIVKSSPVGGSFQNYMLFLLSIVSAKQSIMITNPYFIPDDKIIEALLAAASRRVRVTV